MSNLHESFTPLSDWCGLSVQWLDFNRLGGTSARTTSLSPCGPISLSEQFLNCPQGSHNPCIYLHITPWIVSGPLKNSTFQTPSLETDPDFFLTSCHVTRVSFYREYREPPVLSPWITKSTKGYFFVSQTPLLLLYLLWESIGPFIRREIKLSYLNSNPIPIIE